MIRHLIPSSLDWTFLIITVALLLPGQVVATEDLLRVRPGDELLIDFPGQPELSGLYGVDVRGFLLVDPADPCQLAGLSVTAAAETLSRVLADYFHDSGGLTLRVLRHRLAVRVEGRVNEPGDYFLQHHATIEDALLAAQGIAEGGLLTRVQLYRDGEASELDLREFRVSGRLELLPELYPGDRIYVPVSNRNAPVEASLAPLQLAIDDPNVIHVVGAVRKAGTHRMYDRISLLEGLALGGGPTVEADLNKVRIIPADGEARVVNVEVYAEGSNDTLPRLQAGDTVFVPFRRSHFIVRSLQFVRDLVPVALLGLALGGE